MSFSTTQTTPSLLDAEKNKLENAVNEIASLKRKLATSEEAGRLIKKQREEIGTTFLRVLEDDVDTECVEDDFRGAENRMKLVVSKATIFRHVGEARSAPNSPIGTFYTYLVDELKKLATNSEYDVDYECVLLAAKDVFPKRTFRLGEE